MGNNISPRGTLWNIVILFYSYSATVSKFDDSVKFGLPWLKNKATTVFFTISCLILILDLAIFRQILICNGKYTEGKPFVLV